MTSSVDLDQLRKEFLERRIGGRVGFGKRPAVIVVDVTRAFTNPSSPLGTNADGMVHALLDVLRAARDAQVPIIFTAAVYNDVARVWGEKIPANRQLLPGTADVELDSRLERQPSELVISKHHASAFFGTTLADILRQQKIDTLIVTGLTTSGCVRATVVDGCSLGLRVIVPEEAVADRADLPHLASLFDLDTKYADVVGCVDVVQFLHKRTTAAAR